MRPRVPPKGGKAKALRSLRMNKKALTRNFILLLSLLFLFIAAAVAWFVAYNHGDVDNTGFQSGDAINSQIDTSGGYYNGNDLQGYDVVLTPVSGMGNKADGEVQLYLPGIEPFTQSQPMEDGWRLVSEVEEINNIDQDTHKAYVSYVDYYSVIRANSNAEVALSSSSRVVPRFLEGVEDDDPDERISSYGEFSADYIAGAVRVAFIVCTPSVEIPEGETREIAFNPYGDLRYVATYNSETGEPATFGEPVPYTEELRLIWIPNTRYQLTEHYEDGNGKGAMVLTGADFTDEGEQESVYYYYNGEDKAVLPAEICAGNEFTGGFRSISSGMWFNPTEDGYCAFIKVRIWVEGYDREASVALAGGMFESEIYLLTIQEAS